MMNREGGMLVLMVVMVVGEVGVDTNNKSEIGPSHSYIIPPLVLRS